MKKLFTIWIKILLCCIICTIEMSAAVDNGVYSISCQQESGYVALGAYHDVNPFICYVMSDELAEDAYWSVVKTPAGYTFCNVVTKQWLVYTTEREDQYYKYMTLASDLTDDGSQYWNIWENEDGTLSIESAVASGSYWNLRANQGLLGTYVGTTRSQNERFILTPKSGGEQPEEPIVQTKFPPALHVFLKDGRLEAIPLEYVTSRKEVGGQLVVETKVGRTLYYALTDVDHVSEEAPVDFPSFESFKFNNKFNDQLFTDALGEQVGDTVFVTIAAIGKRLTPSFKVSEEGTEVYVEGIRQDSKVSRLRFDHDIYYVVTRPGCTIYLPSAEGGFAMQPYGRLVRVHVDWLTDRPAVPRIDINTADGEPVTSKDYFKDATISIDGQGIFPSMEMTDVQIKGRGNSSWGWPKKPYRLKFAQKVKPLGMTKGKSWVLLSNYQTGSLMANAIGMKAANLMGASAANHIVPVDLYLNGEYQGSYNFTEKVGFSNNSVDLEDESAAALLELDSYFDEPEGQKFRSAPYNLPINVKEPDFSEGTTRLTLETVETDFNRFMSTLYRGLDITRHVDLEQLARFLMVNELISNFELYHPKSTFCYRESFESDTSKYVFGPVWDLDWAFGYEGHSRYFQDNASSNYWLDMPNFEVKQFIQDLRFKYPGLDVIYREYWEKFMDEDLTELLEYCQDYYAFACESFRSNRSVWGDWTDYQQQASLASNWLETRANQIYEDILNNVRPETVDPGATAYFENDQLYTIKCRRGTLVLNEDHTGLAVSQTRVDAPEKDYLFAIINIGDNNYLYSPETGQFLSPENNGTWVPRLGSAITIDTKHPDGEYQYMLSTHTENGIIYYFNNNGKELVINSWDTPDDGNRWIIEPVKQFDPTEALALAEQSMLAVTFEFQFEGHVIGSEIQKLPAGSLMPEPNTIQENTYVSFQPMGDVPFMVEDDVTVPYEVRWKGPFQFSHSMEDVKWYNMTIRSNYYVCKDDEEPYYPVSVDDERLLQQPAFQWAFGGDPLNVKVYNRTTGLDEVLTRDGQNAVMRSGDYSWDLLSNDDGFVLREHGTTETCINQFGGNAGPLQFWMDKDSPTDNGSTFRVIEVNDVLLAICADDKNRIYGDANPKLTFTIQEGELIDGEPLLSTSATVSSPVGTYPIEISAGSIHTTNRLQLEDGVLTVTKAPLIITANNFTITEGEALPAFTANYRGFKNNETASVLTVQPAFACAATEVSEPGTYEIIVSGAKAQNYDITYVSGTLTIEPAPFSGLSNDKLFAFTSRRGGLVVNADGTGLAAGQIRTDAPETDKHFAVINYQGSYYLYSPSCKQFLQSDGHFSSVLGTPVSFDDTHADGRYRFMILTQDKTGTTLYFNNTTEKIVIDNWDTPDDGNRWCIQPVGDFDPTEALLLAEKQFFMVNNQVEFEGQVVATATVQVGYADPLPNLPSSLTNEFLHLSPVGALPSVVTSDMEVVYHAEWQGPFQFTRSLDDAMWYNMTIRSDYYVSKQETEPYYPQKATPQMLTMPSYQWAFGGDPYHVRVYNRTTGLAEVLTRDRENAVMRSGEYSWDLLPNGDGFILREHGTDATCINQLGGKEGPLQFWTSAESVTDDGSTFRVMPAVVDGVEKTIDFTQSGSVYDLSGRRLNHMAKSGLYIVNGKKVVKRK